MTRPALSDYGWNMLRRAETYESHRTVKMRCIVDRGPILMWECHCSATAYTYNAADPAPECGGGFPFSFSTTTRFDGLDG